MARPTGSKNKNTFEFFKRFDDLCQEHIDPLVLMFQIAAGKAKEKQDIVKGDSGILQPSINSPSFRAMAAKELLCYRYPRLKAVEIREEIDDTQLEISFLDVLDAEEAEDASDNANSDTLQTAQISSEAP